MSGNESTEVRDAEYDFTLSSLFVCLVPSKWYLKRSAIGSINASSAYRPSIRADISSRLEGIAFPLDVQLDRRIRNDHVCTYKVCKRRQFKKATSNRFLSSGATLK